MNIGGLANFTITGELHSHCILAATVTANVPIPLIIVVLLLVHILLDTNNLKKYSDDVFYTF